MYQHVQQSTPPPPVPDSQYHCCDTTYSNALRYFKVKKQPVLLFWGVTATVVWFCNSYSIRESKQGQITRFVHQASRLAIMLQPLTHNVRV